jgi:hypothetical protein
MRRPHHDRHAVAGPYRCYVELPSGEKSLALCPVTGTPIGIRTGRASADGAQDHHLATERGRNLIAKDQDQLLDFEVPNGLPLFHAFEGQTIETSRTTSPLASP